MNTLGNVAAVLAHVLLSGPWTQSTLEKRAINAFGSRSAKRARRLIEELLATAPTHYSPRLSQLVSLIESAKSMKGISAATTDRIVSRTVVAAPPRFEPIQALQHINPVALDTQGDMARWLGIPLDQLEWLTDERRTLRLESEHSRLHHYDRRWVPKSENRLRLIEAPKARMKEIQRRILHEILDCLPTHDAAFGFVKGRDAATAAAKHAGEDTVLTVDLKDYFLHVQHARIHAIFRCLGYTVSVARMLTSLCTTITPRETLDRYPGKLRADGVAWDKYRMLHLPQGAPSSPALANLTSYRLDERLAGLARRFDARYTRYADDLTFSGDANLPARSGAFLSMLSKIVRDEGFALNERKTRIMRRSNRQTVTGLVVNDHINIARPTYDALKATLTNCVRLGPAAQNREDHSDFRAHLDGRITWVERVNLRRGEKLRRLFDAIAW